MGPRRSLSITEAFTFVFVPDSKSANVQSIEISAEALEALLEDTLSLHVDDLKDHERLQDHVRQLAEHARDQEHKLCNFSEQQSCEYCCSSRLNEIIVGFSDLIQSTPSLPAASTAAIHSKIGLLRMKQGDFSGAIESLLKALWIQSSLPASATDEEEKKDLLWQVAITKHRLGLAYGRSGNFDDSVRLLQNAVQDYEKTNPELDHQKKILEQARGTLQKTLEAKLLNQALRVKSSPPTVCSKGRPQSITSDHGATVATQGRSRSPLTGSKI